MADRKSSTSSRGQQSKADESKAAQSRIEEARRKVEQLEAEAKAVSALDDPNDPEKGSPWRQTAYLGAILVGGFLLNLLLLVVLAAAQ